jgi:hypothetical protein
VPLAVPLPVLLVVPLAVVAPLVVVPLLADPATPGVLNPAAPPVEGAGGVITTVEPVDPVVPVGAEVEPVAGGMPRTAPPPSGSRHVTSRFEQNSGIVVRSLEASAAYPAGSEPPVSAAVIAKKISLRVIGPPFEPWFR